MTKEQNNPSFPPPVFSNFSGKVLEIRENRFFTCSFELKEDYFNPLGMVLGGVYGIFFDLAIGPFSYLITGRPCTSLDLNIDFLKALKREDKIVIVKSELVQQSNSFLLFQASAYKEDGTFVASAKSRMMILSSANKF